MEEEMIYPDVSGSKDLAREPILLSRYLLETGFNLEYIHVVWHPVRDCKGNYPENARALRGFFADVCIVNGSTGEKGFLSVYPKYAVVDPVIFYGYECDDLYVEVVHDRGITIAIMWSHAVYGDTVAPCVGVSYRSPSNTSFASNKLFPLVKH